MIKFHNSRLNNAYARPKAITKYLTSLLLLPHNIKYMCQNTIIVLATSSTKKSNTKALSCTESNNKFRISDLDRKIKSK